jgi:hypothetical protein
MTNNLITIGHQNSRLHVVKISFSRPDISKEAWRLQIAIGTAIVHQLNWVEGDRIEISQDDGWFFLTKKDASSIYRGCKLGKIRGTHSYAIYTTCNYLGENINQKIRTARHEIIGIIENDESKGLKVYLDVNLDGREKMNKKEVLKILDSTDAHTEFHVHIDVHNMCDSKDIVGEKREITIKLANITFSNPYVPTIYYRR